MSLTLFFIVLSLAIGYLLYDTFKKSRQKNPKSPETVNNRLKINYTNECTVLHALSKQKADSIKTKTISLHLIGDEKPPSPEQAQTCLQIIRKLQTSRRLYLLHNPTHPPSPLFPTLAQAIQPPFIIPYSSSQGAVAILRQLGTGLHLQTSKQLYLKIRQYLGRIWLVGEDPDQQALREFKTEVDMLAMLGNLTSLEGEDKKSI